MSNMVEMAAAPATKRAEAKRSTAKASVGKRVAKAKVAAATRVAAQRQVPARKRAVAKVVVAEAPADRSSQDLALRAAQNTIAANPLLGIRAADLKLAARALLKGAAGQPKLFLSHLVDYSGALVDVARGKSTIQADTKDKRFADPAWQSSFFHKRLLQAYSRTGQGLDQFIDATDLSELDKERARFLVSLIVDGMAPSNTILGNPAALKKIVDTGGLSLIKGLQNLVHDIRHNGMLPSQVDSTPFELGRNVAATPGSVVFATRCSS